MHFLLLLLMLLATSEQYITFQNQTLCPIGFNEYSVEGVKGCIQVKTHETYSNKYDKCNGNTIVPWFYKYEKEYASTIDQKTFWTDYIRAYKNGPFINWAIGDRDMGRPIKNNFWLSAAVDHDCSVFNSTSQELNTVRCNEKHSRYCFIKYYNETEEVVLDCPKNNLTFISFISPVPKCISILQQPSLIKIKYSLDYLKSICTFQSSHLLNRGYIYSNHYNIVGNSTNCQIPLGIKIKGNNLLWEDNNEMILPDEQNLISSKANIRAFRNDSLVHLTRKQSTSPQKNLIVCEKSVKLPSLNLTIQEKNNSLFVNMNINITNPEVFIWCFTDSVTFYPVRVNVSTTSNPAQLKIVTDGDGYYWCLSTDTVRYISKETTKKLYLKDKNSLNDLRAIMIKLKNREGKTETWKEKDIIKFLEFYNGQGLALHNPIGKLNWKIKQIYTDDLILLHGYANISSINGLDVIYIRNVFECDPTESMDITAKKNEVPTNCSITSLCSGNFNTGWKINTTASEKCKVTNTGITDSSAGKVDDVLDYLASILNSSQSISTNNLQIATKLINDLLNTEDIPGKILQNLDDIIENTVLLTNESDVQYVQPNIAVVSALRSASDPVVGIRLEKGNNELNNKNLHIIRKSYKESPIEHDNDDIFFMIPPEINEDKASKLSFVVFRNDRFFIKNYSTSIQKVNSRIISISITNTTRFKDKQYIDIHFRPLKQSQGNELKICAYWNFTTGAGGNWSIDGCEILTDQIISGMDTCRCNHLTHFAELIRYSDFNVESTNYDGLSIISILGCVLSLLGFTVIGCTGVLFKTWRRNFNNKIWMHLSASVAILIVNFLVISIVDFKTHSKAYCIAIGVTLHYSVLSSFCWMLMSAVLSYKKLVTVFENNSSHRLLKASIFGWVFPFVPIIFLLGLDPGNYAKKFLKANPQKDFCYPTDLGFWLTVFFPIILIVITNTILFIVIIYSVFIRSNIQRHDVTNQIFHSVTVSFLLFFLFGLSWIFGILSENIVMAYLFCITGTTQGLVMFIFFIIGNKSTRDLWYTHLQFRKNKSIPLTSFTSRSDPSHK